MTERDEFGLRVDGPFHDAKIVSLPGVGAIFDGVRESAQFAIFLRACDGDYDVAKRAWDGTAPERAIWTERGDTEPLEKRLRAMTEALRD